MQINPDGNTEPLQNAQLSALTDLYADVAHEVRNVMQAISGTIELEMEASVDVNSRNRFSKAMADCTIVGNLLTGLLKVMEGQQSTPDVNDIVEGIVDLYRYKMRNRVSIVWERTLPVAVSMPALHLRLVLVNVIKNAVEATEESENPTVRIQTIENADNVDIEIWNAGPQIPAENIGAIFSRSFSTKHISGGTGIGLSVTRRLLRHSGGDLTFRNSNNGVAFTIMVPKDHATAFVPPQQATKAATTQKPLKGRKVLVIDDDTSVRDVLQLMIVELGGGNAELCVSGKDAITQIQITQDYDAILLDLRMKGLSGQDVYDILPISLQGRVIFISGDINNPETANFLRQVQRPTLLKPLSARSLFDAIDKIKSR